jgi:hypothetical protein
MTDAELNLVQLKELKRQLGSENRFIGEKICQNAIDCISNLVEAPVKPEIAESIKKQLKENQLMDDIEVVQCMGDPFGIMLPTHILLKNSKEEKWYRQTV